MNGEVVLDYGCSGRIYATKDCLINQTATKGSKGMRVKVIVSSVLAVVLLLLCTQSSIADEPLKSKKKVAVLEFVNKSKYNDSKIGPAVTNVLISELVKSGLFTVIERDKLSNALDEQGLEHISTSVREWTNEELGRLASVIDSRFIVVGDILEFGIKYSQEPITVTTRYQSGTVRYPSGTVEPVYQDCHSIVYTHTKEGMLRVRYIVYDRATGKRWLDKEVPTSYSKSDKETRGCSPAGVPADELELPSEEDVANDLIDNNVTIFYNLFTNRVLEQLQQLYWDAATSEELSSTALSTKEPSDIKIVIFKPTLDTRDIAVVLKAQVLEVAGMVKSTYPVAWVGVNDKEVKLDSQGKFSTSVDITGKSQIVVKAVDTEGTQAQKTITLQAQAPQPQPPVQVTQHRSGCYPLKSVNMQTRT